VDSTERINLMKDQLRKVLKAIREDCEADAKKWDGKELTAQGVATMHGETLAMIDALAHVIDDLIGDTR